MLTTALSGGIIGLISWINAAFFISTRDCLYFSVIAKRPKAPTPPANKANVLRFIRNILP